ncbi:MAG: sigma 54-interacting transcriptional regulator [Pseudomonadota bacterium]
MIPSELLNRIPEVIPFGVVVLTPDAEIGYANPWIVAKAGFSPGQWEAADLAFALPEVIQLGRTVLEGREAYREAGCSIDGSHHRVEAMLLGRDGGPEGAVCCITPEPSFSLFQNSAFHKLQIQELNAIFELSSDGIILCDGEGRIVRINEASERLNGWSAAEVAGRRVQDLVEEGWIDQSATLHVLRTQKTVNLVQYIERTKNHLLVTGTPLFDRNGRVKLVLVNERDMTQLNAIKTQLEEARRVTDKYKDNLAELAVLEYRGGLIKAESQVMGQVLQYAIKLARLDASNILVTGESGVGKGLLAQFIHDQGRGKGKPFIQINCAAMPEGLLEAELFGYEKGAFTGAGTNGKAGLFELAHAGTLFLDEIGDCPWAIQAKLLKYLDDHEVQRLGGLEPRLIDCTIIAATNRDLDQLIEERRFRSDLFYRLNTFTINIPPLRERPEDVFELIMHFLDEFNTRYGFKKKIGSHALKRLQNYGFPGNVRELRNIVKQAIVMGEGDLLDDFILGGLKEPDQDSPPRELKNERGRTFTEQMENFERQLLKKTLTRAQSTRELARLMGTSQPTVVRRLKKYGLAAPAKRN